MMVSENWQIPQGPHYQSEISLSPIDKPVSQPVSVSWVLIEDKRLLGQRPHTLLLMHDGQHCHQQLCSVSLGTPRLVETMPKARMDAFTCRGGGGVVTEEER